MTLNWSKIQNKWQHAWQKAELGKAVVQKNKPKFISIHSRKAESAVLDILDEEKRVPAVLHWYSGSTSELDRAVSKGHYFSINPAMINSKSGKKIIDRIPPERILTETDGPFIELNDKEVLPRDVSIVEKRRPLPC